MAVKQLMEKAAVLIKKYRYAAMILLVGVIFLLLPTSAKNEKTQTVTEQMPTQPTLSTEEKLAAVLSQIHGAGKVEVMLTVQTGGEIIYQTDEDISESDGTKSVKRDTVTVTDSERNQTGLVRQENPPQYLGAIIVCEGADMPSVQLAIVDAVSKATGLGANRISVLKMK